MSLDYKYNSLMELACKNNPDFNKLLDKYSKEEIFFKFMTLYFSLACSSSVSTNGYMNKLQYKYLLLANLKCIKQYLEADKDFVSEFDPELKRLVDSVFCDIEKLDSIRRNNE